jgi:cytochrome b561
MSAPSVHAYSPVAKGLHWLVVALVVIQFGTALAMPDIGPHTAPTTAINLHFSFGVTILLVMAIRFVHRLLYPVPLEASAAPAWERLLAKTAHRLIYLILLVAPGLGWASASAHGLPVSVFGIVELPAIAARKAHWALVAGDIHMLAMWSLLVLVGLHAAAALYHHFVRRDDTLRRMLPSSS